MDKETATAKHYEVGFLGATPEVAGVVENFLKEHGGEITNRGSVRDVQLAYPIEKRMQAVFGFFQTRLVPEAAKNLEAKLRAAPSVLRALIVALPTRGLNVSSAPVAPRSTVQAAQPAYDFSERKTAPPPAALSNEALEKKIEEILQ